MQTRETVHCCELNQLESVLLLRVKGSQLVAVDFQIGDRSPLHCTSIGKRLLAHQDVALVAQLVARGLTRRARRTITGPATLRQELHRVRRQGYACDVFACADDRRCVAVPVDTLGGVLQGDISLSGPSSRLTQEKRVDLRDCARHQAQLPSADLGPEWPAAD